MSTVGGRDRVAGDRDAGVAEVFDREYLGLLGVARLLLGDRHASEEVVQEGFLRLYRSWDAVAEPGAYLRVTVVNLAYSSLRHRGSARRYLGRQGRVSEGLQDDPAHEVTDRAVVVMLLAALPRRQRECLVLRYYADLDEAAIAEALRISRGSVKTHLHRGLAAVRARRMEVSDDG